MSFKLDVRSTCALLITSFLAFGGGCAPSDEDFVDLGEVTDNKADGIFSRTLTIPAATNTRPGHTWRRLRSTTDFQIDLAYDGDAQTRIRVRPDGNEAAEISGAQAAHPSQVVTHTGAGYYDVHLDNYLKSKLTVRLTAAPHTAPAPVANIKVRFTTPMCPALPDKGVPAGAHCQLENSDASRAAAGVTDNLLQWINDTTAAKQAHPERPMKITMAYLTWSDGRYYDALCRATAAGIKLEGYFDLATAGSQPGRFVQDAACKPENISIKYAGGRTDFPDWRLMHIKMTLFDTGEPTVRLVFSSANVSSFATSLHFENWVFAEFPTASHFIESHRCAARALDADAYDAQGNYPAIFQETYAACLDELAQRGLKEDPRYRVFFTPDSNHAALDAAIAAMAASKSSVSMAIQHFNDRDLAQALAAAGRKTALSTRLVVDDDTFYGNGEGSAGEDRSVYFDILKPAGVQTHFMQTTFALHQYQHNKYIVVDKQRVFCGAGNFSPEAFRDNYENFYLFDDPAVASQYADHFDRMWGIAQPESSLPADYNY